MPWCNKKLAFYERERQTDRRKESTPDMNKNDPYYKTLTKALETPELYKVCSVCGCVAPVDDEECPYCAAYRFNTEAEAVSNTALDQLTRSFDRVTDPVSSAYD